jgi:hypothetical protein
MALHDFVCLRCHAIQRDVNVPIAVGARAAQVRCPDCQRPMDWLPQVGSMDAKEPSFQTVVDVGGVPTVVGSLHQMRRIERETEQRSRNGEGQPLVWRDYSQNRSNFDQHTLAKRMDRSMDTQDGFLGGMTEVDKKKVDVAKGPDVAKRQGL